jgi:hypothetical protein
MDVRKSPAEAGLSRSLAFQTGLPRLNCPSSTRSEGTAQSSGIGGKPTESNLKRAVGCARPASRRG